VAGKICVPNLKLPFGGDIEAESAKHQQTKLEFTLARRCEDLVRCGGHGQRFVLAVGSS